MSERRPADEMTDPGPPPEEALDATLRALGAPVPAQTRRTPESAGLDAAHYHADPHRPPKAHEPSSSSRVATTEPMAAAVQANVVRDTIRMEPREQRLVLTTVPRAAPAPSRMSTFLGALVFVVLVLGVAAWALMRSGSQPDRPTTVATSTTTTPVPSGTAVAVVAPVPTAPVIASGDTSSATTDAPRPTGRPQPATTATSTALPRHVPSAATSAAPAPSPPPAITTTPVAPPAPTTKYNRFLEEDKK
ncbi:MAG: hypothetical protein JWO86_8731 [Myxococcaceae bacterium]|nr:hypothetical protein [Myxococcaceae bacterium]